MNTKTNILQNAIDSGCKTVKDLALFIKKQKYNEKILKRKSNLNITSKGMCINLEF